MDKKAADNRPTDLAERICEKLDAAYQWAENYYTTHQDNLHPYASDNLNEEYVEAIEDISRQCEKASTGYLNILTGLAIKAVYEDAVDVRYHQVQIQEQTEHPAGFNFRGVSEKIIYPWMEDHEFHGAKSGWQTRTFERPKPYLLSYDENIGSIKTSFLTIYDQAEKYPQSAIHALGLLLLRRIELRNASKVSLAVPNIKDVLQITNLFSSHFFYAYKDSKGASRLPVLALYAVYTELLKELQRYDGKKLKPLEAHSAADSQTGSIGDIEVLSADGSAFEAVEVKHQIVVSKAIVDSVKQKIKGSRVDRYYILTTSHSHEPSAEVLAEVEKIQKLLGTQVIVNGVIPTLRYYLRLLSNPAAVLSDYVQLLQEDSAIGFEHRDVWNKIATGDI